MWWASRTTGGTSLRARSCHSHLLSDAVANTGLILPIPDAWNGRDRDGVRARFADDVVVEDRRHAGLGRVEGADAYAEANAVLWDLAPDQKGFEEWHMALSVRRGSGARMRFHLGRAYNAEAIAA
jgi:hypothetical protein